MSLASGREPKTTTGVRLRAPLIPPTLLRLGVPAILVAAWWAVTSESTNPYSPPLERILVRFQELWLFDRAASDVLPTLTILWSGFIVSVILGVVSGLLLGLLPAARATFMPLITFYRALPGVALIPVFIQLLGFGDEVRFLIVVIAALPPTLIATIDGVLAVERTLVDVSHVYGLTRFERLAGVLVPAAGPKIFAGVQVSLQFSFIAAIAAEMVGGTRGIGHLTLLAQQTFRAADMWAGVLLLGVVGVLSNLVLTLVRRRVLGWHDRAQAVARYA